MSVSPFNIIVDKLAVFDYDNISSYLVALLVSQPSQNLWTYNENFKEELKRVLEDEGDISQSSGDVYTMIFSEINICDCYIKEFLDRDRAENNLSLRAAIKNVDNPIFLSNKPAKKLFYYNFEYRKYMHTLARFFKSDMTQETLVDVTNTFYDVLDKRPKYEVEKPSRTTNTIRAIWTYYNIFSDDISSFNTEDIEKYNSLIEMCDEGNYYKNLRSYDVSTIKDYYLTFYDVAIQKLWTNLSNNIKGDNEKNLMQKISSLLFYDITSRDSQAKMLFYQQNKISNKEHLDWRFVSYKKAFFLFLYSLPEEEVSVDFIRDLFQESIRNISNKHRSVELYNEIKDLSLSELLKILSTFIP